MYILIVKFQVKPLFREAFLQAAIGDAQGSSHNEPGCLRFDVIQDEADPNRIYFYEVYKDQAAFQEHTKAPHFLKWRETVSEDWYAEPTQVVRGWNVYPPDAEWK